MSFKDIEYKVIKPNGALAAFVDSYWMIVNHSKQPQDVVIVPDGRIDIFFSRSASERFDAVLIGLGSKPDKTAISPEAIMFAVSLKPLAAEYILHTSVAPQINYACRLPAGFWDITEADLESFEGFCKKAEFNLQAGLNGDIDKRKLLLFDLMYDINGDITVKELSEKVSWNSRQINRYFSQWFGLSLKSYLNILRFRASINHIAAGKLFPEQNFTDQAHFIREIKRFTGVVPKELHQNKNDRFIQFLAALEK